MTEATPGETDAVRVKRLERRLDRELRARQEAEQIAEAGLRSLYDANQELDQRILERTAELNEALAAAEAANAAKSAFLGQMSHQINTPLNGLLGMLELLATEMTDAQTEAWHASAMRSARRLERLTTRIITYVELESADLTSRGEPRRLRDILSDVHDRWHGVCLRAGQLLSVEMRTGADVQIVAPAELDLMWDELLSNSVEHGGPGAVTIAAQVGTEPDTVAISLTDAGSGIDEGQVARTHQLNASADQTTVGDAQVHLGLALVDRIVTGLNGSWNLDDGQSSAIVVVLPTVH